MYFGLSRDRDPLHYRTLNGGQPVLSSGLGERGVRDPLNLYADDDPDHTGRTYNRMMYATTRDFINFSQAEVWNDPGYSVIDSTVIEDNGIDYRLTKDERSSSPNNPCGKFILAERSAELRAQHCELVQECVGQPGISRGEGPTIFKSNTEERWYLFIDEFGGRGYAPFTLTRLDAPADAWTIPADYELPSRPRHGTVLPITRKEHDVLLNTYGE